MEWGNKRPQQPAFTWWLAGFAEVKFGSLLAATPAAPFGVALALHGADNFVTGCQIAYYGQFRDTATVQGLQMLGVSHNVASLASNCFGIGGTMGAGAMLKALRFFETYQIGCNCS